MKIIITGAYAIGTHLARLLSRNHEDITLIDPDPDRLARIGSDYDLLTMVADPDAYRPSPMPAWATPTSSSP